MLMVFDIVNEKQAVIVSFSASKYKFNSMTYRYDPVFFDEKDENWKAISAVFISFILRSFPPPIETIGEGRDEQSATTGKKTLIFISNRGPRIYCRLRLISTVERCILNSGTWICSGQITGPVLTEMYVRSLIHCIADRSIPFFIVLFFFKSFLLQIRRNLSTLLADASSEWIPLFLLLPSPFHLLSSPSLQCQRCHRLTGDRMRARCNWRVSPMCGRRWGMRG